jgi:hypothetical protein
MRVRRGRGREREIDKLKASGGSGLMICRAIFTSLPEVEAGS